MNSDSLKKSKAYWPSNDKIIEEHLNTFRNSKSSQSNRKSCLNYFFDEKYFGYNGHVFDIGKQTMMKYSDYLKHLKTISLSTKKNKWTLFRSFLAFCEDFYEEEFGVFYKFPRKIQWSLINKESESNAGVFLTLNEVKQILRYLKKTHFKYYLMIRILAESGTRKGGLRNLDHDKVNLEMRYIDTIEKTGRVIYYISPQLRDYLKFYLEERKKIDTKEKALFLSTQLKRYSDRPINVYLKKVVQKLGIKKAITCQVFRRSLNYFRFEMGCSDTILRILLCQHVDSVNFNNYISKNLDYNKFLEYYDEWNPYINIDL